MTPPQTEAATFTVDLQPIGQRVEIESGTTLLTAAQSAGLALVSLCGGEGWCYGCMVRIVKGEFSPPTSSEMDYFSEEEISEGFRLACQTIPLSDAIIDIPPDSLTTPQRLQVEGQAEKININPPVNWVDLELPPATLQDLRADAERLLNGLEELGHIDLIVDPPVYLTISETLRDNNWSVRVAIKEDRVMGIYPKETPLFGLASDIGTTKVAVYLVNLSTGEVVDKDGEMNPQIAYGEDVISRIAYTTQNEGGRQTLQGVLVETINKKIEEMCTAATISPRQIVEAVFVGNTAMHHLLAGLPVRQLALAPYVPAVSSAITFPAKDIGVNLAPGAEVYLLPNIAGYVGSDHTSAVLSSKIWRTKLATLLIDIGTNTEITLAAKGRWLSCSCASGPAFEGAHIKDGMRAAPGAIERVKLVDDEVHVFTIGDQPPVGLCGSGILDAVAELRNSEIINEKGKMNEDHPRVSRQDGSLEYLLVSSKESGHGKDVTVSRKDINEIQLAKAAIRAGQDVLLAEAGIVPSQVDEVIVAGAFGTYIDIPNALRIGMFPDIPADRFVQVGNAAGMGAIEVLLDVDQRETAEKAVAQIEYIELTTHGDFQKYFMQALYL